MRSGEIPRSRSQRQLGLLIPSRLSFYSKPPDVFRAADAFLRPSASNPAGQPRQGRRPDRRCLLHGFGYLYALRFLLQAVGLFGIPTGQAVFLTGGALSHAFGYF